MSVRIFLALIFLNNQISIKSIHSIVIIYQHEGMMTFWVNKIAQDLWEFNNKVGNWEDYKYQAWRVIFKNENECINSTFLNKKEFDNLRDNYSHNILVNSKTHNNIDEINNCINK